jgi:EAL domain-containing protein (putative c-di-GMP-specific phosphodiesterase class I)
MIIFSIARSKFILNWGSLRFINNISASAFLRPYFGNLIKEKAAQYQIDRSKIILEYSENTFIKNIDQTIKMIKGFKDDGFSIAIDDFGRQYSSLGILDLFPYDFLKLDGIFANRLESENIKQVVRGLAIIAERQNVTIIAEKIETIEMADNMKALGCFYHQGFYYHRPEIMDRKKKSKENQTKSIFVCYQFENWF